MEANLKCNVVLEPPSNQWWDSLIQRRCAYCIHKVFSSGSYSPVELALWVGSGDVDVTLGLSVSLVVALALAMDMCGSNVVRW